MPAPTTTTAADIASLYGKGNTLFSDSPNVGVSGTSGYYGRLGSLSPYSPQPYTYTDYTPPATMTSISAQQAALQSNIMAQNAQAQQGENAQRGQAILSGYGQRIANNRGFADQQSGMIDAYGASQRLALEQQRQAQAANARQSAMSRGLGNTTIQDAMTRGVNADYARNQLGLNDQLLQNRLNQNQTNIGLENQLTGERLQFLGAIQNPYPTLADISNLYLQSGVLQETATSRR